METDTNPAEALPQDQQIESLKLIALVLLEFAAVGTAAAYVVSRWDAALDVIIRNQHIVWPAVGVLIASTILFMGSRAGYIAGDTGLNLISGAAKPFSAAALSIIAAGTVAGATKPLPPEIGIDIVKIYKNGPKNRELLLFIHGWNGDAKGTWRQFPQLAAQDPKLAAYNV